MEDLKKYIGQVITVWTKNTNVPCKGKLLAVGSVSITVDDMKGKKLIPDDSILTVDV